MSSIEITFVEPGGTERVIDDADEGETLMELAKANGVEGILGDCGGGCACATCHVYVDPAWMDIVGKPDDVEDMTLDMAGDVYRENSRLCCQITVSPELNGLKLTVAPPEE